MDITDTTRCFSSLGAGRGLCIRSTGIATAAAGKQRAINMGKGILRFLLLMSSATIHSRNGAAIPGGPMDDNDRLGANVVAYP
jgi:hypothetical protein